MKRYLLLPVIVLVATGQLALADHCTSYSTTVNTFPEGNILLVTRGNEGADYLLIEFCQPRCAAFGAYYGESNGIPGLQRADARGNDLCHESIRGDTFVTQFGLSFDQ